MDYGIDITQLRRFVVRPALKHIELHSVAAENLVVGTALVESRGEYVKQLGSGPAIGLFQMEPFTRRSIHEDFLRYNEPLEQRVESLMTRLVDDDDYEMIGNLYYAAAMCRCRYRWVSDPLPPAGDYEAMASYWKDHYNTPLGAGTVHKAVPHFRVACGG